MDNCIVLLILIIVIAFLIILQVDAKAVTSVIGGGTAILAGRATRFKEKPITPPENTLRKLYIGDKETLVIDGHNMIHRIAGRKLTVSEFEETLIKISNMINNAFPTQDLHIVIKNPPEDAIKRFNKMKRQEGTKLQKTKKRSPRKKTSEERIPYFSELVKLSKKFPRITYHLAYGKESKAAKSPKNHYLKGRDDYLAIKLAKNSYVVSQDRYRDFNQFSTIKSFKHYSTTNGVVHDKETIRPITDWRTLNRPGLGNHFIFKIISADEAKKKDISNGGIYLTPESKLGCMYIIR